jgi:antitoxin (DNA-binding transcriptional repressor) of toxin-antitoxin stability system
METFISSTDAVRHMGDVLARVKHTGETFVLTKSDKPLARLVRFSGPCRASGAEIMKALNDLPWDPEFADDLERVNGMDRIPENPWD